MNNQTKDKRKIAYCPHCGEDKFKMKSIETIDVSFAETDKPPYYLVDVHFSGTLVHKYDDVLICHGCNRKLDRLELLRSIVPIKKEHELY